jgi:ubiquinone/menaquinone biosynthesis C-methylase UbiE
VKAYYHARAPEYDDWWQAKGHYSFLTEDWMVERDAAFGAIRTLAPARTLDVGCGTGFVTRLLPGEVVAIDQSPAMVEIARTQAQNAEHVVGDGLALPFPDASFERVFTSHFYGHLEEPDRAVFLSEARRVAPELVVFDAGLHGGEERAEWQVRVLDNGSRWKVYKRFFTGDSLAAELGGGTALHDDRWFVLVRSP